MYKLIYDYNNSVKGHTKASVYVWYLEFFYGYYGVEWPMLTYYYCVPHTKNYNGVGNSVLV